LAIVGFGDSMVRENGDNSCYKGYVLAGHNILVVKHKTIKFFIFLGLDEFKCG
jgi:hypothetical protein